jgi:hypothetical protein
MSGGAGATGLFGSCLIMISPGAGGAGGFKYRTAISCIYSSLCFDLLCAKENQSAIIKLNLLVLKFTFYLKFLDMHLR